jgi:O-antigen/teichoic acid export membrane protein
LLIIFGDFGISTATSKFVAEYDNTDKQKLKLILFNSLLILTSLSFIVVIITVIFGKTIFGDKYIYALYVLPIVFLAPISSLYDGIFRGLKRFKDLAIICLSSGIVSLFFTYTLVIRYGLIGALVSQSLYYLILVVTLLLVYRNFHIKIDKHLMKTVFNYSLILGISNVAFFLYSKVDIVVLGHYGYIEEIGYYELIDKVFTLMMIPFIMFGQVIAPNITKYHSEGNSHAIKAKFKKYVAGSILISALLSASCYALYPSIMSSFFAKYYTHEFITMINILLPLFILKAVGGGIITQGFTIPTGHASLNMKILLFTGPLNLVLNIIFINLYGYIGVIYATFVVWILTNTILIKIYYLGTILNAPR